MTTGLRIVVTGANRGLGLEMVRQYLHARHRVIATARRPDDARELRGLVDAHPEQARLVACDVTADAQVAALADSLPWDGVDVLINNAGEGGQREETLAEADLEGLAHTFSVNAIGPLRVTRALWPAVAAARGKIVHISSLMGSIADSSGTRYSYRMSKAALNMAARCLGFECERHGMITFALHPGWVRTDMGGPDAPLEIEDSVGAMISTIASRTARDNGRFLDRNGDPLAW
jgi:NAD(P)-dependent dehydrogenase (short-subunit alcohol dehydrogenase family)